MGNQKGRCVPEVALKGGDLYDEFTYDLQSHINVILIIFQI